MFRLCCSFGCCHNCEKLAMLTVITFNIDEETTECVASALILKHLLREKLCRLYYLSCSHFHLFYVCKVYSSRQQMLRIQFSMNAGLWKHETLKAIIQCICLVPEWLIIQICAKYWQFRQLFITWYGLNWICILFRLSTWLAGCHFSFTCNKHRLLKLL